MVGNIIKRLLWIVAFAFLLFPFYAWGYSEDECALCHRQGSSESRLQIDIKGYRTSIHGGEIGCADCHIGITDDEHFTTTGLGKVCCGDCHEQENLHDIEGGTQCYDCHAKHTIYSADDRRSSVNWRNLENTCGTCHPDQTKRSGVFSMLTSFQIVSHPKQDMTARFDRGMCVGCHQGQAAHGEEGPINDQNCYKCHSPFNKKSILLGYIHSYADWQSKPVNVMAGCVSVIGIIGFILILVRSFIGLFDKRRH